MHNLENYTFDNYVNYLGAIKYTKIEIDPV